MDELQFRLNIGYPVNGKYTREIELLRSNAVAEEVFTQKTSEKPYTWIANVVSVATNKVGDAPVGAKVRDNYLDTNSVVIPPVILDMPLADANSMLLEIHRRVWENDLPDQKIHCQGCGKTVLTDIDLDKVILPDHLKEVIKGDPEFNAIECRLKYGIDLGSWIKRSKKDSLKEYEGALFNKLTFRIPTLRDAIKNEGYASDSIQFWRRIGADCLTDLEAVKKGKGNKEVVTHKFPDDKFVWLGLDMYNYADAKDLKEIRKCLTKELPTMPFSYMDECACPMKKTIPVAMEATNFFSE